MWEYLRTVFRRTGGNAEHQAFLGSLENELQEIDTSTDHLSDELVITSSTGKWLEKWGAWFGTERRIGETDDSLRDRILETLTQERLTIPALIALTKKVMGDDTNVTIYEPYEDVFQLDVSKLDEKRLMDGEYYTIGVVDIAIDKPVTSELVALLNLIKAAGIKLVIHQV